MRNRLKILIYIVASLFAANIALAQLQSSDMQDVVYLVNIRRIAAGITPVIVSDRLMTVAQHRSDDMAASDSISTISSNGNTFLERIAVADYNMVAGAEVVAYSDELDVEAVLYFWENNLSDIASILNPDYQEIGAGYSVSESGTYYYTLILARRDDFVADNTMSMGLISTPKIPDKPTATFTNIPTDTATPLPPHNSPTAILESVEPTVQIPSPTPFFTNTPLHQRINPSVTKIPQQPTQYPTISPDVDLHLEYDENNFSLTNISGRPLWLEGLTFKGSESTIDIGIWNNGYMTASLRSFPSSDCLQAWDLSSQQQFTPPDDCNVRHSWLGLSEANIFWKDNIFTIYRYDEPIQICYSSTGVCNIDLEERLSHSSTTSVEQPANSQSSDNGTNASDITLIYDNSSFSLLNTSYSEIDLTGLGFSSASGVMNISQWHTEYLSASLNAFPAGDCLQAWPITLPDYPDKSNSCRFRHAWLGVADYQTFWIGTDTFSVSKDGLVLATCSTAFGTCEINLP